jgi:hypothetical protein
MASHAFFGRGCVLLALILAVYGFGTGPQGFAQDSDEQNLLEMIALARRPLENGQLTRKQLKALMNEVERLLHGEHAHAHAEEGNGFRWLASRSLGLTTLPLEILKHLNPVTAYQRSYRLYHLGGTGISPDDHLKNGVTLFLTTHGTETFIATVVTPAFHAHLENPTLWEQALIGLGYAIIIPHFVDPLCWIAIGLYVISPTFRKGTTYVLQPIIFKGIGPVFNALTKPLQLMVFNQSEVTGFVKRALVRSQNRVVRHKMWIGGGKAFHLNLAGDDHQDFLRVSFRKEGKDWLLHRIRILHHRPRMEEEALHRLLSPLGWNVRQAVVKAYQAYGTHGPKTGLYALLLVVGHARWKPAYLELSILPGARVKVGSVRPRVWLRPIVYPLTRWCEGF